MPRPGHSCVHCPFAAAAHLRPTGLGRRAAHSARRSPGASRPPSGVPSRAGWRCPRWHFFPVFVARLRSRPADALQWCVLRWQSCPGLHGRCGPWRGWAQRRSGCMSAPAACPVVRQSGQMCSGWQRVCWRARAIAGCRSRPVACPAVYRRYRVCRACWWCPSVRCLCCALAVPMRVGTIQWPVRTGVRRAPAVRRAAAHRYQRVPIATAVATKHVLGPCRQHAATGAAVPVAG